MVVVLILIILNGIFAMSEIAIVSARSARLKQRADEGEAGAITALELSNNPNNFLSTVQVGISLVGVLSGAFGGATIAAELEPYLEPFLGESSSSVSFGVVVAIITYLSLVIGELVPKQIGLSNPERVASLVSRPMRYLSIVAKPLVWLLSISTNVIMRILPISADDTPPITQEEVRIMLEQGAEVGVFDPQEEEIVDKVFRLADLTVDDFLTPRLNVVWLDLQADYKETEKILISNTHSRYPVCDGRIDKLQGMVLARDLLTQRLKDGKINVKKAMTPALFFPQGLPAFDALNQFKSSQAQIGLVIDEYGGFEGIITLHDLMEGIVGDVPERGDPADPQAVQRDDGSWLIDGMFTLDNFADLFELKESPHAYYQTIGGFTMATLGRIPKTGDQFSWGTFEFEVVDMDWKRVDKVLVRHIPEVEETDAVEEQEES